MIRRIPAIRSPKSPLRVLGNQNGLALIEFALSLPIILAAGGYGVELSYLAITNMRVSQSALNLADNAARVGNDIGAGVFSLREADVNDIFQGVRLAGTGFNLTTNGRITLSSLENVKQSFDTSYVQRIHWQRCLGLKSGTDYTSHYGTTSNSAGSDATAGKKGTASSGMGEPGSTVKAPQDGGVMFVEINYEYQPLFGTLFIQPRTIRYAASLMVRDNRDFSHIDNPDPAAPKSTCNKFSA